MNIDAAAPATSRSISLKIKMKNIKRLSSYTSIVNFNSISFITLAYVIGLKGDLLQLCAF